MAVTTGSGRHPRVGRRDGSALATVLALTAALGLALPLATAAPAAAHDVLETSDPADGATVTDPTAVTLTFSAEQLPVGALVEVVGPDGELWSDGEPAVEGRQVVQALRPDAPPGAYAVRWRSVSNDGHPIEGELSFTVEGTRPAEPGPGSTPEETPVASPSPDAVPAPSSTEPTAPDEAPAQEPASDPAAPAWVLPAAVVGGALLAAAALLAWHRRRGGR